MIGKKQATTKLSGVGTLIHRHDELAEAEENGNARKKAKKKSKKKPRFGTWVMSDAQKKKEGILPFQTER